LLTAIRSLWKEQAVSPDYLPLLQSNVDAVRFLISAGADCMIPAKVSAFDFLFGFVSTY
jgi:hypothetical protein